MAPTTLLAGLLQQATPQEAKVLSAFLKSTVSFDVETAGLDEAAHPILEYGIYGPGTRKSRLISARSLGRFDVKDLSPWVAKNQLPPNTDLSSWPGIQRGRAARLSQEAIKTQRVGLSQLPKDIAAAVKTPSGERLSLLATNAGFEGKMMAAQLSGAAIDKYLRPNLWMNEPAFPDNVTDTFKRIYVEGPTKETAENLNQALRGARKAGGAAYGGSAFSLMNPLSQPRKAHNRAAAAWAGVFNPWKEAFTTTGEKGGLGDPMDLISSNIAMAQKRGLVDRSFDFRSGTNIDLWQRILTGIPEGHTAFGDARVTQKTVCQWMLMSGMRMQQATKTRDLPPEIIRAMGMFNQTVPVVRRKNVYKTISEFMDDPTAYTKTSITEKSTMSPLGYEKHYAVPIKREHPQDLGQFLQWVQDKPSAQGVDVSKAHRDLRQISQVAEGAGASAVDARLDYIKGVYENDFATALKPRGEIRGGKLGVAREFLAGRSRALKFGAGALGVYAGLRIANALWWESKDDSLDIPSYEEEWSNRDWKQYHKERVNNVVPFDPDFRKELRLEGLHPGAGPKSKFSDGFKEFGSGYKGLPSGVVHHDRDEALAMQMTGVGTFIRGQSSIYRNMMPHGRPIQSTYNRAVTRAGRGIHKYRQSYLLNQGSVRAVETPLYNTEVGVFGTADLIDNSGRIGEIKTVSDAKWAQIHETKQALKKHEAQLQTYLNLAGVNEGFVEYIPRSHPNTAMRIPVFADGGRFDKRVGARSRARVKAQATAEQAIRAGAITRQHLPTTTSVPSPGVAAARVRVKMEELKSAPTAALSNMKRSLRQLEMVSQRTRRGIKGNRVTETPETAFLAHRMGLGNPEYSGEVKRRGSYTGRVLSVEDADTLMVLNPKGERTKIRLHGADAPESVGDLAQPGGAEASAYAKSLMPVGSLVDIKPVTTGVYGRTVAAITTPGGDDLASELIRSGHAWHYKQYSKNRDDLASLQRSAQARGAGMWGQGAKQAPWDYRKQNRELIAQVALEEEEREKQESGRFYRRMKDNEFRMSMLSGVNYNTIEGLHPGAGAKSPWSGGFTDFGSRWRGLFGRLGKKGIRFLDRQVHYRGFDVRLYRGTITRAQEQVGGKVMGGSHLTEIQKMFYAGDRPMKAFLRHPITTLTGSGAMGSGVWNLTGGEVFQQAVSAMTHSGVLETMMTMGDVGVLGGMAIASAAALNRSRLLLQHSWHSKTLAGKQIVKNKKVNSLLKRWSTPTREGRGFGAIFKVNKLGGLHPGAGPKSKWSQGFTDFGSGYRGLLKAGSFKAFLKKVGGTVEAGPASYLDAGPTTQAVPMVMYTGDEKLFIKSLKHMGLTSRESERVYRVLLAHEGFELHAAKRLFQQVPRHAGPAMTQGVSTHISRSVVADEALLSFEWGKKYFAAMKKLRSIETQTLVKNAKIQAYLGMSAGPQAGLQGASALRQARVYEQYINKVYSNVEKKGAGIIKRLKAKYNPQGTVGIVQELNAKRIGHHNY